MTTENKKCEIIFATTQYLQHFSVQKKISWPEWSENLHGPETSLVN